MPCLTWPQGIWLDRYPLRGSRHRRASDQQFLVSSWQQTEQRRSERGLISHNEYQHNAPCQSNAAGHLLYPQPSHRTEESEREQFREGCHLRLCCRPGLCIATPLYFASKHVISAFVRSLGGLDNKMGTRVAAVAPGLVRTLLISEHPANARKVDFKQRGLHQARISCQSAAEALHRGRLERRNRA